MLYKIANTFRRLYWWIRRPITIGARAIVTDGKSVLLVNHSYLKNWYLPGGGVGRGETLQDVVRRELKEEVGFVYDGALNLLATHSNFGEYKNDHIVLFEVKTSVFEPKGGGEVKEAKFFAFDHLPVDISPATKRRIEEYLKMKPREEMW
ncbi:MAG TPA: NUDIX domain-containing protein [bacterium]|nr:MAG: NUDIX domain-containing protein [Candidatus Nomurabacteria bacterium]HPF95543.1 NUDIX domain-containing protein [bacterium]